MERFLPVFFVTLGGIALLCALYALWQSFRVWFGVSKVPALVRLPGQTEKRAALVDEKQALLRTLKDLEFERAVGKVSEEDFARLDAQYRTRAKEILRELDTDIEPFLIEARKLVAQAVRKVASKPESSAQEAERNCAGCGTRNDSDAAFCKKCGKPQPQGDGSGMREAQS